MGFNSGFKGLSAIVYDHAVQLNCILLSKGQYACRAVKPEENTIIWQLTWLEEYEKTKEVLVGRSQWPRGLRCRSASARLLRLWVRIPPGASMSVACVVR